MRHLLLLVLAVSLVGILTVPNAFAEIYYQEGHQLVPSFSIEYPDGWNSELETKWLSQNGYEGYPTFSISLADGKEYGPEHSLWNNLVMVSYYPDYGTKQSDSQERAAQIYDYDNFCNNIANLKEDGYTCKNFQVFHKVPSSYTTDGFPIITNVFKETRYYPDSSEKVMVTTASTIYVGNNIWDIVTDSELEEFDKSKSTLFDIINSFRQPAQLTAASIPTVVSEQPSPTTTYTREEVLAMQEEKLESMGCLIATAAFGSEMSPQVQLLREIRDNTVLQTESGSAFMTGFNQFYYSFSPTVADYERENPAFKEAVKITLTPLLASLALLQYADIDSESEMLGYGIGVILLNIGMYFVAPAVLLSVCIRKIPKN